jgi:hypothetical protein
MEDCKVCKQLIKEKHRREIWWKVFCIIFCALSIILGILYFGGGYVEEVNEVEIQNSHLQNNGNNGSIIIGSENIGNSVQGTITDKDYTPIICITVIAGVAVLVAGGVLIANNIKKDK